MSATVHRAEAGGRVLTYVAAADGETADDAPRVYLGSHTELIDIDGEPGRKFRTAPKIEVLDSWFSPEDAEELARRLLIAAANVRIRCDCGHAWWEHFEGRQCDHADDADLCRCGGFVQAIAREH